MESIYVKRLFTSNIKWIACMFGTFRTQNVIDSMFRDYPSRQAPKLGVALRPVKYLLRSRKPRHVGRVDQGKAICT
jgi:hypothetical protein